MKAQNLNIVQDIQHQLFYVRVNGGNAYLKYEKPSNEVLDFKETYVPKSSRGKGVASGLAAYALKYADSKNLNVTPTCPFVKRFIKKNRNKKI
jgi:uncharacterized protein